MIKLLSIITGHYQESERERERERREEKEKEENKQEKEKMNQYARWEARMKED